MQDRDCIPPMRRSGAFAEWKAAIQWPYAHCVKMKLPCRFPWLIPGRLPGTLRHMSSRPTVIVDAYNVMHSSPAMRGTMAHNREQGRRSLLAFCAEWLARRRDVAGFCIVFDGDATVGPLSESMPRGIRILYAHGADRADGRIVELLDAGDNPADCIVVTADRELARRVHARGAGVWTPDRFLNLLRPASRNMAAACDDDNKNDLSPAVQRKINEEMRRRFGVE